MPTVIESLVLDGTVALIALVVLAVEMAVLLHLARRGRKIGDLLANALSGAALILALGAALLQQGALAVAMFLALAFVAHIVALVVRLRA